MLNLLGTHFSLIGLTYLQAGLAFLHGEELSGETVQYYDPEDDREWFTDASAVTALGKALNYHEGVFALTEYDDDVLHEMLRDADDAMDVYDNWKRIAKPW